MFVVLLQQLFSEARDTRFLCFPFMTPHWKFISVVLSEGWFHLALLSCWFKLTFLSLSADCRFRFAAFFELQCTFWNGRLLTLYIINIFTSMCYTCSFTVVVRPTLSGARPKLLVRLIVNSLFIFKSVYSEIYKTYLLTFYILFL